MTGIEQLRKLGADAVRGGEVGRAICDIADQIERERECDADTIENLRLELGEARDDAAWVRAHGGLDYVKSEWRSRVPYDRYERRRQRLLGHIAECETALGRRNWRIEELEGRVKALTTENAELRKRLMPEGMEWPRFEDGELVHVGDSAPFGTDDVMEVTGVEINRFGYVIHGSINDGMRECVDGDEHGVAVKRPAPKVLDADGAEIRVGDTVYQMGCKYRVSHLHGSNGKVRIVYENSGRWVDPKTLTHRAPVLAADGRPLEVGQTVWDTNGDELVIGALEDGGHTVTCRYVDVGDAIPVHGMWSPSDLTHQRPVLDADGKPLREGEAVYLTDSTTAFVVDDIMTREDGATVVHLMDGAWHLPQYLTHERPDSWGRIEEDLGDEMAKQQCGPISPELACKLAGEFVRRCKELARKENNNE